MIESRRRITIMDGYVETFSTSFVELEGITGTRHKATGPFEISASRNAIIVHRAELTDPALLDDFLEAINAAKRVAIQMSQDDRGNF